MRTSRRGRLAALLAALAAAAWLALSTEATCSAGAETRRFGKTSVGRSSEVLASDRKRVNSYPLGSSATVTQLSAYLEPTSTSGQQTIEGVVYADSKGAPGALVGASTPITFASTHSAGSRRSRSAPAMRQINRSGRSIIPTLHSMPIDSARAFV